MDTRNIPKDKRLTRKEKFDLIDKDVDELWNMFLDYVENNLEEFANAVSSQSNYKIRYWLDDNKISSVSMPSNNWVEQLPTANMVLELFDSYSQWKYPNSVTLENLSYIFELEPNHTLVDIFSDYEDKITELVELDTTKRYREIMSEYPEFRELLEEHQVWIVLTALQAEGLLKDQFTEYKQEFEMVVNYD